MYIYLNNISILYYCKDANINNIYPKVNNHNCKHMYNHSIRMNRP